MPQRQRAAGLHAMPLGSSAPKSRPATRIPPPRSDDHPPQSWVWAHKDRIQPDVKHAFTVDGCSVELDGSDGSTVVAIVLNPKLSKPTRLAKKKDKEAGTIRVFCKPDWASSDPEAAKAEFDKCAL